MERKISQAHQLGRGEHRRDPNLLPPAARPQEAHEIDQHARAPQRGDSPAHLCRADLSQRRKLPSSGSRAVRGDPRSMARSPYLSEHATLEGIQKGGATSGSLRAQATKGMNATPLRRRRSPQRGGKSERRRLRGDGFAGPHDQFAELDAHNSAKYGPGTEPGDLA